MCVCCVCVSKRGRERESVCVNKDRIDGLIGLQDTQCDSSMKFLTWNETD